jgi:uncharacterized protein YndB with AHSA1/START domain
MPEPAVERTVDLPAPPEEVWEAVTDAEQLSRWFADDVELDARPGGRGRFVDGDEARRARVDEVEPARRLAFRWWPEDGDGPVTRVELVLEPCPEGTRLVIVETPVVAGAVGRWTSSLGRLEARLASRVLV